MESLWNLYGIWVYLWNIYGIWVEYEWNINGIWVLIDIVTADHLVTGRDPTDGGKSSPAAGEESRPGLMKTVSEIWRRNSSLMVNIAWHLLGILYFSSIVPKECLLKTDEIPMWCVMFQLQRRIRYVCCCINPSNSDSKNLAWPWR